MRFTHFLLLGIVALLLPPAVMADEPVSLERTFVRAAPEILKQCREKGYKNVGVLKFLGIKDGDTKLSDSLGTLNRSIAKQLELALLLANDRKAPIGIIDDASDVAAKTPGANHITKAGQEKLFGAKYPLAWGSETVTPDAFISGVVGISKDLKTMTVKLFIFDSKMATLEPLGKELVAVNDPRRLSEMGESFTRGAFDDGKVEPKEQAKRDQQVLAKAAQVKLEKVKNPAEDATSPVKLQVLYDGKVMPIEVRDGKAFIPEANEGQVVSFQLKRNTEKGTLACVLKVNGENTLFRQTLPDVQCRKWLLFPDNKTGLTIVGFQKTETVLEKFRIASREESKAREINYGTDVGTITLTVFGENTGTPPALELNDESQRAKILENAQSPETKPKNFDALTAQLFEDAGSRGGERGGLIVQGKEEEGKIRVVKFTSDPNPLMSLTVTYYKR